MTECLHPEFSRADSELVALARDIRILGPLSWPASVQADFLARWSRGDESLPQVSYPKIDHEDRIKSLRKLASSVPRDHPLGDFLAATAGSYATICELIQAAGSGRMSAISQQVYGRPGDPVSAGGQTNLQAAKHFLDTASDYYFATHEREPAYCLPAETLQAEMLPRLAEVFGAGTVAVEIDPNMASKAAAGATRVRLRAGTCFSEYDLEQLLQHEAFIHSLTSLNGRSQPSCRSLSLGAPRTTMCQEGLATFSELVTGAIDIDRLERIAMRVVAVDMALNGADFLEVFRFFLAARQSEMESFSSAMRIFRGAPLTGGHAFTKDVVYLHGMVDMHTFFRWSLQHGKFSACQHLFAGRMALSDVHSLGPLFDSGELQPPRYLPPWMTRTNGLAGYLAFSIFANRLNVASISADHQF